MANTWKEEICNGSYDEVQKAAAGCNETRTLPGTADNVINTTIGIVGLLAVIFIIVGGFQYITSSGDAAKATKAKNTILYAVIGLVIALLAYAIVNFVIEKV